jgi:hypothetical protein
MERLFNVPVELFQLEEVKLNKSKSCIIKYKIVDDRGDKTQIFTGTCEPNYMCVIAMQERINDLKPHLAAMRKRDASEMQYLDVTGLVWKGYGKSESFQILGKLTDDFGKKSDEKSSVYHITSEEYKDGMKVRDIIIDLESMAHAYIFEGKMADMTMGLIPIEDENETTDKTEVTEVEAEEVEQTEETTE